MSREVLASCAWHYAEVGSAHGYRMAASPQRTVTLVHSSKLMPQKMIQMIFKGFIGQGKEKVWVGDIVLIDIVLIEHCMWH